MSAWPSLVNLLRRRRFDISHRLLFGLGAFPQSDASFDEPALLRRPELLNQRVDARLALIAVVAIDSHLISSRTEFALVGCARLVLGCRLEQGGPEDGIGGQRDEAHSGHHVGRVSRRDAARLCRTEHRPCYLAIAPVRPDRVSQLAVLNANCSEVNVAISRGDVHWKGTAFLGPDPRASSFPTISPHQSLYEKASVRQ